MNCSESMIIRKIRKIIASAQIEINCSVYCYRQTMYTDEEAAQLGGLPRPGCMNQQGYWLHITEGDGYRVGLKEFYYRNKELFEIWSPRKSDVIYIEQEGMPKTAGGRVLQKYLMCVCVCDSFSCGSYI